jgi:Tol biopolymer transport system component
LNWKHSLLVGMGLCLFLIRGVGAAPSESLVFLQNEEPGKQTLYVYQPGDAKLSTVSSGAGIAVFLRSKHFFYFSDHQLYEYDLSRRRSKLINRFKEGRIQMRTVAESGGLDQLLVVANDQYEVNWYILDLQDNSLRRINQPSYAASSTPVVTNTLVSPDEQYVVTVKSNTFKGRISMTVKMKNAPKKKTFWQLPANQTVLPGLITWAPDSRTLLFHAKAATGAEGFYALYSMKIAELKPQLVAETVLYWDLLTSSGLEEFFPDWAADSRYVVFQCQPTGSPAQSVLLKYELQSGQTSVLTQSNGQNLNPRVAPSGKWIAFLSNRDHGVKQLYLLDQQGQGLKRVLMQGATVWAEWFK